MVIHNLTPGETQAQKVIDEKGVCSCLDANERGGAHSPYTLTRATGINGDVAGTLDANYYRNYYRYAALRQLSHKLGHVQSFVFHYASFLNNGNHNGNRGKLWQSRN